MTHFWYKDCYSTLYIHSSSQFVAIQNSKAFSIFFIMNCTINISTFFLYSNFIFHGSNAIQLQKRAIQLYLNKCYIKWHQIHLVSIEHKQMWSWLIWYFCKMKSCFLTSCVDQTFHKCKEKPKQTSIDSVSWIKFSNLFSRTRDVYGSLPLIKLHSKFLHCFLMVELFESKAIKKVLRSYGNGCCALNMKTLIRCCWEIQRKNAVSWYKWICWSIKFKGKFYWKGKITIYTQSVFMRGNTWFYRKFAFIKEIRKSTL